MQRSRQDDRAGRDRLTVSSHMRRTDTSSGTSDGTEANGFRRANSAAITLLVGDSSEPPVPPLCLRSTPLPSASSASAPPRHLLNLLRSWLRLNSARLGSASAPLRLGSILGHPGLGSSAPRLASTLPAASKLSGRDRVAATSAEVDDVDTMVRATRARFARQRLNFFRRRHKVGVRLTMACSNLERLQRKRFGEPPSLTRVSPPRGGL